MKIFRQIYRGCTTLPYVGEHPGTQMVIFFLAICGFFVLKMGLIALVGMIPVFIAYFYGAYDRANYSDRLIQKEKQNADHNTSG